MKILISRFSNKELLRRINSLRRAINTAPKDSVSHISEDLTVNTHSYFWALIAEYKKREKEGLI